MHKIVVLPSKPFRQPCEVLVDHVTDEANNVNQVVDGSHSKPVASLNCGRTCSCFCEIQGQHLPLEAPFQYRTCHLILRALCPAVATHIDSSKSVSSMLSLRPSVLCTIGISQYYSIIIR